MYALYHCKILRRNIIYKGFYLRNNHRLLLKKCCKLFEKPPYPLPLSHNQPLPPVVYIKNNIYSCCIVGYIVVRYILHILAYAISIYYYILVVLVYYRHIAYTILLCVILHSYIEYMFILI